MKKKTLDTDEILQKIKSDDEINEDDIAFVSQEDLRHELANDIAVAGYSMNKLASECSISQSHLSDFLSNKKKLNRDKLLSIFITLGYDIDKIQKSLMHFGISELYPRDMRDFIIMKGIKNHSDLDLINENLGKENLDTLCYEKQLNISQMNFHFILILIFSTVSTIPTHQNFITLTSQKSKMSTQIWHRTSQVSLLRSFPKNSYLFIKQYPKIGIHTLKLFLELFLITTIPIMLFQSASL